MGEGVDVGGGVWCGVVWGRDRCGEGGVWCGEMCGCGEGREGIDVEREGGSVHVVWGVERESEMSGKDVEV